MNRHRVRREDHQYSFHPTSEPILRVEPGATVVVETFDCFTNKITSPKQVFAKEADLLALVGEFNPISRPIHIEGAQPGDTLAVRIDDIALGAFAPYAVTILTGDFAGICGRPVVTDGIGPDTRICPLESDDIVFPTLGGDLRLPTRPMVGTIGTAPADRSWISLHSALGHGGNMDCPSLTVGSTVLLPVNVAGGLLSLGDVHASMGDAEVTGTALETNADVTIKVDLLKADSHQSWGMPQLATTDFVGAIGCEFGVSVEENLAHAFGSLQARLAREYTLTTAEALELLGTAARVQVNQCVGGNFSAVYVSMSRSILARLGELGISRCRSVERMAGHGIVPVADC